MLQELQRRNTNMQKRKLVPLSLQNLKVFKPQNFYDTIHNGFRGLGWRTGDSKGDLGVERLNLAGSSA